jgi:hypothetical protein
MGEHPQPYMLSAMLENCTKHFNHQNMTSPDNTTHFAPELHIPNGTFNIDSPQKTTSTVTDRECLKTLLGIICLSIIQTVRIDT